MDFDFTPVFIALALVSVVAGLILGAGAVGALWLIHS